MPAWRRSEMPTTVLSECLARTDRSDPNVVLQPGAIPSFIPTNRTVLSWSFAWTDSKSRAQRVATRLDALPLAYPAEPRLQAGSPSPTSRRLRGEATRTPNPSRRPACSRLSFFVPTNWQR